MPKKLMIKVMEHKPEVRILVLRMVLNFEEKMQEMTNKVKEQTQELWMVHKFEVMILEMAEVILKQWMVLKLVVSKLVLEMDFKPEELLTLIMIVDVKEQIMV